MVPLRIYLSKPVTCGLHILLLAVFQISSAAQTSTKIPSTTLPTTSIPPLHNTTSSTFPQYNITSPPIFPPIPLSAIISNFIHNNYTFKYLDLSEGRERRQLFGDGDNGVAEQRQQGNEPRSCTSPSNEDGYCKDLSDCPDLILDLTNLRRSICFKGLFIPGVCCPKSALRTTEEPTTRRPLVATTPRRPVSANNPRPGFGPDNTISRPAVSTHPNAQFRCGVPRVPEKRIVGGEESPRGKWPWMAAIFLHGPKKTEFWCGASIVSARFVLTAAHCTKDPLGKTFNPRQFTVRLGDYNIFSKQDDHLVEPETFRVEKITPHPDFKARGFYNDVALIKLDREVRFNDFVAPVCLPPPAMAAESLDAMVGQTPTVIGYGSTHYDGDESPTLREAKLPVWTNNACDEAYLQPITDIFLCAGYKDGGTDACQGDSGGPLLLYVSSRQWVQIGIVSFGNRCAEPGYPGVYTRLTKFMPWIHENMVSQS